MGKNWSTTRTALPRTHPGVLPSRRPADPAGTEEPRYDPAMLVESPYAPVTVVILTLNEEINLADCLASCRWCDDVHVVDSGSQDRTVEIARAMGATVHRHPFTSFGAQRNWAIDNIDAKHDWIFHLDADERFTPELVKAIAALLASNPPQAGFHVPHKMMFMGRWLKRSGGYPTYQMRLFHRTRMRFCDYGHGQRELTEGEVGVLDEPYLHYSFSKGLYDWLDKHNRYSSLEALQVISETNHRWFSPKAMLSRDRVKRWRAWKAFSYHLPFRATLRWFVTLFVMGGVFEGRAGWNYARLIALYERMIILKLKLMRSAIRRNAQIERELRPVARTTVTDVQDPLAKRQRSNDTPLTTEASTPAMEGANGDTVTASVSSDNGEVLQTQPERSPWSFWQKVARAVWMVFGKPIFRMSFHDWYRFRNAMLRLFGAKIGKGVTIRPSVNVEIPWNLEIEDGATVGDHAILYSLGTIRIGKRSIVSQYAHLCAGTHDYTDSTFKLLRLPITIGDDVWIGADAFIGPGVNIGSLAVVGARSSVYKDMPSKQVCVGNPAKPIKERVLR